MDSVYVINQALTRLTEGETPSIELKGNLDRNVSHLKLVVADPEISGSGNDISALHTAIASGSAKLAESIWPAETNPRRLRP